MRTFRQVKKIYLGTIEKYSANKILGKERIAELEAEYRNRPVQMELFDL